MKKWSPCRSHERKLRERARQFVTRSNKPVDRIGYEIRVAKRGAPPDRVDEIWVKPGADEL
jgi:hypothetical protein